jgi:hypothetical protein
MVHIISENYCKKVTANIKVTTMDNVAAKIIDYLLVVFRM